MGVLGWTQGWLSVTGLFLLRLQTPALACPLTLCPQRLTAWAPFKVPLVLQWGSADGDPRSGGVPQLPSGGSKAAEPTTENHGPCRRSISPLLSVRVSGALPLLDSQS